MNKNFRRVLNLHFISRYFIQSLRRVVSQLKFSSPDVEIPKLMLWSGHDTTVLPFLASFGSSVWNSKWPPYATVVALEVKSISQIGTFSLMVEIIKMFKMTYSLLLNPSIRNNSTELLNVNISIII